MALPYTQMFEFNDRYVSTVILLDGKPIYVRTVNEKPALQYAFCGQKMAGKFEWIDGTDPKLFEGPFVLGYMNDVDTMEQDENGMNIGTVLRTHYITRVPVRRWKQGLDSQNLRFPPRSLMFAKALEHPGFRDMIIGEYPTVKQACDKLGEKVKSVAFGKRLAVEVGDLDDYNLLYRGTKIGLSDTPKKWKLGTKFAYMKEWLESQQVTVW